MRSPLFVDGEGFLLRLCVARSVRSRGRGVAIPRGGELASIFIVAPAPSSQVAYSLPEFRPGAFAGLWSARRLLELLC